VVELTEEEFERLVGDAIDSLPAELGTAMENVAVVVEHHAPAGRLLGLYEGVPLTQRGTSYSAAMPDRITIFHNSICAICRDETEVVERVRRTVIHEIAHHFGIGDDRLDELGWA
jgi:predicted Zn-dependent protease with MMP-like domain